MNRNRMRKTEAQQVEKKKGGKKKKRKYVDTITKQGQNRGIKICTVGKRKGKRGENDADADEQTLDLERQKQTVVNDDRDRSVKSMRMHLYHVEVGRVDSSRGIRERGKRKTRI